MLSVNVYLLAMDFFLHLLACLRKRLWHLFKLLPPLVHTHSQKIESIEQERKFGACCYATCTANHIYLDCRSLRND
jgi:hypothetical protein